MIVIVGIQMRILYTVAGLLIEIGLVPLHTVYL
jgi:hypothetical protein